MYHPDVEAREIPADAERLRDAVRGADAVIIACPEYNSPMTSALKNAIEWLSRRGNLLSNRVFYIMGTGTGRSGCMKMHLQASYSLESEGGFVLHHPRVLLPHVTNFMDEAGNITDPEVSDLLDQAGGPAGLVHRANDRSRLTRLLRVPRFGRSRRGGYSSRCASYSRRAGMTSCVMRSMLRTATSWDMGPSRPQNMM